MVKTRRWIERELLSDEGLRMHFDHAQDLHAGVLPPDCYADRSIGRVIENCETRWGPLRQVISDLLGWQRGLWFYAGWIDQIVLHIGKVETGDRRLFESMLRQFDADQVDQGGDMLVGFAPDDEDWLVVVEVSPQDDQFTVGVRTNAEEHMETINKAFPS